MPTPGQAVQGELLFSQSHDLLSSFNPLDEKYSFATVLWFQAFNLQFLSSKQTCSSGFSSCQ